MSDKDLKNTKTIIQRNFEIVNPADTSLVDEFFSKLPSVSLPSSSVVPDRLEEWIMSFNSKANSSFDVYLPWEEQNIFPKSETKKKDVESKLKLAVNCFANHISEENRKYFRNNRNKIDLSIFDKKSNMAVLSVDVRNSTRLMEKAVSEEKFGEFLAALTESFKKIVLDNHGVYDKFTGDGVICYFPEFYSGKDYLFFALKTSQELHHAFKIVYKKYFDCFKIVIESGLGIGIDSGEVLLKLIADDITIIGDPVVNACRLNGAPAYSTYINTQALVQLKQKYSDFFVYSEVEYNYKHEGNVLVHKVDFKDKIDFLPEKPDMENLLKK